MLFFSIKSLSVYQENNAFLAFIKIIHEFRDSVPIRKMHGYANILSNFSFLSKRQRRLQCIDTNNPLQTVVLYCVYLFKLYDKSIIILLTNDLTNIYSEISKILLILFDGLYLQCEGQCEGAEGS